MGKIAASVLLKLFINGYERCHTTDAQKSWVVPLLSNHNNKQSMIPENQKIQKSMWAKRQTNAGTNFKLFSKDRKVVDIWSQYRLHRISGNARGCDVWRHLVSCGNRTKIISLPSSCMSTDSIITSWGWLWVLCILMGVLPPFPKIILDEWQWPPLSSLFKINILFEWQGKLS